MLRPRAHPKHLAQLEIAQVEQLVKLVQYAEYVFGPDKHLPQQFQLEAKQ